MFYSKMNKYPKTETIEVAVSDFSKGLNTEKAENVTETNYAVNAYNFNFKSGVLTEGVGVKTIMLPKLSTDENDCLSPIMPENVNIKKLFYFKHYSNYAKARVDYLIFVGDDYKIYYSGLFHPLPQFFPLDDLQFTCVPYLVNYKAGGWDYLIMVDESTEIMYHWNGSTRSSQLQNQTFIPMLCEYKGKTFITAGDERHFIRTCVDYENVLAWPIDLSEQLDTYIFPANEWGTINKLLTFAGYMFAIYDYGICRISWPENSEKYSITRLFSSGSKIYRNTVVTCGSEVYMLCKDGVYKFDAISATKVDLKLGKYFEGVLNKDAVATYRAGIYYVACKLNFGDDKQIGCETGTYVNNALIAINVEDNSYTITRGVDICDMLAVQFESMDKVMVAFNTVYGGSLAEMSDDGKFFSDVPEKYWCSPLSDLGYADKQKQVKEISLLSKYDCSVKVFSETEERTFLVKGANIVSKFPVRINGKQIGISITSTAEKAYISNLKLKVDLIDNEYV